MVGACSIDDKRSEGRPESDKAKALVAGPASVAKKTISQAWDWCRYAASPSVQVQVCKVCLCVSVRLCFSPPLSPLSLSDSLPSPTAFSLTLHCQQNRNLVNEMLANSDSDTEEGKAGSANESSLG